MVELIWASIAAISAAGYCRISISRFRRTLNQIQQITVLKNSTIMIEHSHANRLRNTYIFSNALIDSKVMNYSISPKHANFDSAPINNGAVTRDFILYYLPSVDILTTRRGQLVRGGGWILLTFVISAALWCWIVSTLVMKKIYDSL